MNLESYIRKNRSSLDIEKPDEEYLWTGISEAVKAKSKRSHLLFYRSIAAASVILILSVTFSYFLNRGGRQQLLFVNSDPALANQEIQFTNQIESYSKLIKQSAVDIDQLATGKKEIQYIDDLIGYYSKDLKQNGSNPKLVNSLMDLYQKKIMLLERMLNEIEKSKNHEKRNINI
jgi:hypothetical protein